ncbi:hypothetical protein OQJ18_04460 [Fluoribacter dumoffii]|uniref:Uncharacterized protein n=1 Tax=Fluoribacter dumoffii TaxID=463 RepID=A0A377G9E5_9GAMM|nr:hypothetical protein [Fluoribacter dumoffii]KTC90315.1 hypothetical protein Ldum_1383 [Fluoribacter dumoffii NY 23]MCW8385633.1 hypothetical protein [Fluoribacter dumoffii]MCW8418662.1 hypothetical protein [Fluoribacter dumoffii]MCW8453495.1 hypothetical protein [Fluoribacter dumoffii]MCW8459286.1 hypothetical protein [Fluoribacter dumoffii]
MYSKKETEQQPKTEYQIGVCVKETNNDNGPGHVTALLIKKKAGVTRIHTTSYYPSAFGSIINGLSLGSIPVPGQLAQDHVQDVQEANHVLVSDVPKEQFKKAKEGHTEFSEDVKRGRRFYSVFGTANPLAKGCKKLAQGARGAELVVQKHIKETGFHPPEDMCGIHVYDNDHPTVPKLRVDNCASSVTHILRRAGYDFDNPTVPTFFTKELERHGFSKVDKDAFVKEHCNI